MINAHDTQNNGKINAVASPICVMIRKRISQKIMIVDKIDHTFCEKGCEINTD